MESLERKKIVLSLGPLLEILSLGGGLSIWIFRSFWLLLIVQTGLRISDIEEMRLS